VPLSSELKADELSEIIRRLRSQSCNRGAVIMRRGERADSMYWIAEGEVEIELPEQNVLLGPGQFFGDIAALRKSERSATARARDRVKLLVLDAADLHLLMDRSPRMAERIRAVVEERIGVPALGASRNTARKDLGPDDGQAPAP
jgi:voltage-gated potassium channel